MEQVPYVDLELGFCHLLLYLSYMCVYLLKHVLLHVVLVEQREERVAVDVC
jgi:hypothetical protein